MRSLVLLLALAITACSQEDMEGREITEAESTALDTCNEWLSSQMRGAMGTIQSEEAIFAKNGADQLDIAWQAKIPAGEGPAVCSTDASGRVVKGALVDGLQVQP